ncbi:KGK domain-containing protein [Nodularia sphaerocarpa]|uniref:KGK domain-containing protein n=1 Tax=Nodularia sphaerocarpa TaxID=137816 RepID=UPI001EFAC234|nr:KGK domain-containing protein [Nodularia sphaerocarpa]MDB9374688.1 KGK domain-containing protein [Nodularia sphaerocarpa CS-585]MDB9378854.1 KGK domain-containing protein [Nodularia sphaerocarpa CS-585A2]ULP73096.1 hypothetical protein BDGGKGIB_02749 [Nodularia sphaerocarpa UHCC 0038]
MSDLNDDDVVCLPMAVFGSCPTLKIGDLMKEVKTFANRGANGHSSKHVAWFSQEGAEAEVLQMQKGKWQKGRLRFRLEFIPDETDSPFDDSQSQID